MLCECCSWVLSLSSVRMNCSRYSLDHVYTGCYVLTTFYFFSKTQCVFILTSLNLRSYFRSLYPTCSTLINFLSFAQLSLISKKMSALTLSLLFSKIECAPDHHSLIKSALFFQSFGFFFKFSF